MKLTGLKAFKQIIIKLTKLKKRNVITIFSIIKELY